ncbi:MAG: Rv3235 family protein [Bifidobacteriaceae bacterium]|nr:Rv3235 family protein [Bifidobacteriaceae bacterium]
MPQRALSDTNAAFEAAVAHVPRHPRQPVARYARPAGVFHQVRPPDAPDPIRWAAKLAISAAQASRGLRPVSQLHRWVSQDVFEAIRANAQRSSRLNRSHTPKRTHLHVRRIRISEPAQGVVEAAVVIDDGHRPRAVAMRLEWRRDRWIANVLDFL